MCILFPFVFIPLSPISAAHTHMGKGRSNTAQPFPSLQLSVVPQVGGGVSPVPPHPYYVGNGGSPECVETLMSVNFNKGPAS